MIEPVTMYPCPVSGKLFKTLRGAQANADKLNKLKENTLKAEEQMRLSTAAKLEQQNYVRLNLRSVDSLAAMIKEKAKEFWNVDADLEIFVQFSKYVSNSHGAPIGEQCNWSGRDKSRPEHLPGWSGQIVGTVVIPKNLWSNFRPGAVDWLFGYGGFKGFHTGGGCGGDCEGKYKVDIGFYFFLQDFPLLAEQHKEYLANLSIRNRQIEQLESREDSKAYYVNTHPSTIELSQQISSLQQKLAALQTQLDADYIAAHPVVTPEYSPNIKDLEKNFGALPRANL